MGKSPTALSCVRIERDGRVLNPDEIIQRIEAADQLHEKLKGAIERINYFGGHPKGHAPLYAGSDTLYELLDGIEGESITLDHLRLFVASYKDSV